MTVEPIRNDDGLKTVFRRLENIFKAEQGTAPADERDVLVTVVEVYENMDSDFGPADPVAQGCRRAGLNPPGGGVDTSCGSVA